MNTSHPHAKFRLLQAGTLPVWALLFAGLVCLAGPSQAQAQVKPAVGTVLFVSGPTFLIAVDGARQPLRTGSQVRQGEQVATEADGYAHVRMIDNAFVAVRPDSRLAIELYEYDAANPAASRIKLQLHTGNARTVSGKGGEAAKHNYRFNTPMAAIGLRGTDYSVTSSESMTRVSVSRGAVAVTPLGVGCMAATLGPCATLATRELSAGVSHAYMEVNARNAVPVLVRPEQDPRGTNAQNPANRPEEPLAEVKNDLKLASAKDANSQVAADRIALGLGPVQAPSPEPSGAQPPVVAPPPVAGPSAPPPQFVWGRWTPYAKGEGAPAVGTLPKDPNIVMNTIFGLIRTGPLPTSIPSQGSFDFQMAASEAYTLSNGVTAPAEVLAGSFGVNFNRRTFNTALSVQHGAGVEQLSAQGTMNHQGLLRSDKTAASNMTVLGAVAGNGSEAAYLFNKQLSSGDLLGAVRWVR